MAENLGTAALYLTVETTGMEAGLAKAQRSIKGLGPEAQKQFDSMTSAQKRAAVGATQYASTIGLAREEVKAMNVEMKIGGPLGKQLADNIRAAALANSSLAAGAGATTKAMGGTTKTAKELQFAMRGVPAQMTDIFTSLASGQRPMMVMLQQGGQLKDMFGGIGPAAKAMGASLVGLINPLTVTAAAAGALAIAWHKGSEEAVAFNKAIIMTGNYAGVTAGQMAQMAEQMDRGVTTQHDAAAALAQVAASGKFTAEEIALVGQAAADMERATGQATEKTIEQFAALKKEPVQALLKMNETTHFLTQEIYEQVKALEEQGRMFDASKLAMESAASSASSRARDVEESLGVLERAWRGVGETAKDVWDQMLNIGRADTLDDKIQNLADDIVKLQGDSLAYLELGAIGSEKRLAKIAEKRKELRRLLREQNKQDGDAYKEGIRKQAAEAAIALNQQAANYATAEQKRAVKIAKAHEEANRAVLLAADETGIKGLAEKLKGSFDDRRNEILLAEQAGGKEFAEKIRKLRASEAAIIAGINAEGGKGRSSGGRSPRAEQLSQEEKAAARLVEQFQSQNKAMERQIALWGDNSQAAQAAYDIQQSGLRGIDAQLAYEVQANAAIRDTLASMDIADAIIADNEKMAAKTQESFDAMTVAAKRAGENIQDSLGDFLFDPFKNGLDGMVEDFADTLKRMAAELAASELLKMLGQWGTANAGDGNTWANLAASLFAPTPNAKGGVYNSPSLSSYSGGVYDSPKLFAFAKGAGVFGEAGPEAIMPLSRGKDGKLGVSADGVGGGTTVIIENHSGQPAKTEEGTMPDGSKYFKVIIDAAVGEVNKQIANMGSTGRTISQRFGVNAVGVSRG